MKIPHIIIFIIAIRLLMLFIFKSGLLPTGQLWNDKLHHYHIGILLLFVFGLLHYIFSSTNQIALSLSAALVIEEYAVVLYDIGINKKQIYYLSRLDNFILVGICLLLLMVITLFPQLKNALVR